MKNLKSVSIVSLLSLSLVTNGLSFAMSSTAEAAEATQTPSTRNSFDVIANSLKSARKNIALGGDTAAASANLGSELASADITLADLDAFVKTTETVKEYDRYKASTENALAGVGSTGNLSKKEFAEIMTAAMSGVANDGLAYEGCSNTGRTIGWILIAATVVIGIVALVKTKGVEHIKRDYESDRNDRTNQYNDDKNEVNNYGTVIPQEEKNYSEDIQAKNSRISYLANQNSNLDPESSDFKSNASEIEDLTNRIRYDANQISDLADKFVYLQDPNNRVTALAKIESDYKNDMTNFDTDEQKDIANVPSNKKLAGTLGIVSGATAAIGTGLVILSKKTCR